MKHKQPKLKDRARRESLRQAGITVPTFRNGPNGTFVCVQTGARLRKRQLHGFRAGMINNRPGRRKEQTDPSSGQNRLPVADIFGYLGTNYCYCPHCDGHNNIGTPGKVVCGRCGEKFKANFLRMRISC